MNQAVGRAIAAVGVVLGIVAIFLEVIDTSFASGNWQKVIRQLVAEGWQVTAEDLAQLSPYLTSHILRFGAYATDERHIPPDVFDPALDEVDFPVFSGHRHLRMEILSR